MNEKAKEFEEALQQASASEEKIMMIEAKFQFDKVVATQGVTSSIPEEDIQSAMIQYVQCDWGIICDEDKQMNDEALVVGNRLLAKYTASNGTDFYIITEWDRSVTTILLPSEY